jgi:O-antigen/teichoic acid export membrane protein
MLAGGMVVLATGSSNTFMIMAGLERQNLNIQLIRAVFIIVLSLFLIPLYGMISVVVLYVISILFIHVLQLIYINKNLSISPFSYDLFKLLLLTFFGMYFAINQEFIFQIFHFITVPILVYVCYFGLLFKPFKKLVKEIL